MVTRFMLVLLIGLLAAVPAAFADYYKYRDRDGVLRFTDDLGEVPADQRPKTARYREVKTAEQPPIRPQLKGREKTRTRALSIASVKQGNQTKAQWLIQEQRNLHAIYKMLMNEKMALANGAQHLQQTPARANAYREDLDNLNRRIAKFERLRASYSNQAGTMQDQIKKEKQRQNRPKQVASRPRTCLECAQKSAAQ